MMITAIAGAALFLLLAAGLIAYQNSRLIRQQEAESAAAPTGKLMYSVFFEQFHGDEERPEAVPLFQYTVLSGPEEQLHEGETGTTYALCRVPAGTGEMTLEDARQWMQTRIRAASIQGVLSEYLAFPGKADRRGEKELIINLEATVREEAGYGSPH
ncbi:hypothetical protein [Paenibacillus typhae]|uniref:hypothetical protein n=1 Tax=Paenibacillus typhae TaxID=1174501 RepID=UPI001C8E4336|nr:hypothetical protein [Paenibacillus typhae]MBY0011099.1 hypothetical protein [Paenibacillus typhae]